MPFFSYTFRILRNKNKIPIVKFNDFFYFFDNYKIKAFIF